MNRPPVNEMSDTYNFMLLTHFLLSFTGAHSLWEFPILTLKYGGVVFILVYLLIWGRGVHPGVPAHVPVDGSALIVAGDDTWPVLGSHALQALQKPVPSKFD